jgi:hypothetical protein
MSTWLTDGSANKIKNSYFQDIHNTGIAIETSGNIIVNGSINSDNVDTNTLTSINGSFTNIDVSQNINFPNSASITGSNGTIYIDTLDISSALIRDLSCNDASINILQAGIIQSISADTFDLIPNAINIVNFGTDASYINIGGTNSNVTISNTTINDISATTITSTNIISNDISVNDLSCQTASFTSVDISSIIIHEKIIQLDISDCFVNSFDASFGNISQTLTIDQSGSLIVNGTTTMNKLLNVNNSIGINLTDAPRCSLDISASDAILVPRGDNDQRPSQPYSGMFRYDSSKNVFEGYKDDNWVDFTQQNTDACGNIIIDKITNDYANVKVTGISAEFIEFNINNGSNYVTKLVMDASGRLGLGDVNGNPARTLSATLDISGDVLIRGETDINNMTIDQSGNVDICGNLQIDGPIYLSSNIDISTNANIDGNLNVKGNVDISGTTVASGTIMLNNEKNLYFDNPRRGTYIGSNTFSNILDGMGNVNIGTNNVMYEELSWQFDISFNSTDVSYSDVSLNAVTYGDKDSTIFNKFLAVGDASSSIVDSSGGEVWNSVNASFNYESETGFQKLRLDISGSIQLILNEVQVWVGGTNIALNVGASTNNIDDDFAPGNAVDGNVMNINNSTYDYDFFETNGSNTSYALNNLTITLNQVVNIEDIQAIVIYSNMENVNNMIDVSLTLIDEYSHEFVIAHIDTSHNYYVFQGAAYNTVPHHTFVGGSGSNDGIISADSSYNSYNYNKLRLQRFINGNTVAINEIQVWQTLDISNVPVKSLKLTTTGIISEIQLWSNDQNQVILDTGDEIGANNNRLDEAAGAGADETITVDISDSVTFDSIQSIVLYMTSVNQQIALPSQITLQLYEEADASGTLISTIVTNRDGSNNIIRFDGNDISSYDSNSYAIEPSTTQLIALDASGTWTDISFAVQDNIIPLVTNLVLNADVSVNPTASIKYGIVNYINDNNLTDYLEIGGNNGAYIDISFNGTYSVSKLASIVIYVSNSEGNTFMDNMSLQLLNDASINYQYNIFGVDASDIYFRFDGPDISSSYFTDEPSIETIVNVSGETYIVNMIPDISSGIIPSDISINNYFRPLNALVYANNYYLTAGQNCIFYSTDGGYNWNGTAFDSINDASYCQGQYFTSLAYSGSLFVAVANDVSNIIVFTDPSSGDFSSVITGATGGWNSVAYGNDCFVGVGNGEWFVYDGTSVTATKHGDGTNALGNFTSVAYGNNVFVATIDVSGDDISGNLYYSTDKGQTWNPNGGIIDSSGDSFTNSNWKLVKYVPVIDGGYFSAFASGDTTNYTDSSGGIYWSHAKATGQTNTYTDLAAGYSTTDFSANYVLVGNADPSYNIAFSNSVVENCINIGNNNQNGHNNSIAIGNNIVVGKDNIIKLGGNDQELIIGNNLGIGEVDAPQTRLHLSDNISTNADIDYNLCITYENTDGYDWRLGPYIDTSGGNKFSLFGGNGLNNMTPYLTFDTSNNVDINVNNMGIGTIEPASVLHFKKTLDVSNNYDFLVTFENSDDNFYDWRIGPWIGDNSSNIFSVFGGGNNYSTTIPLFNIDGNGNVGIGAIPEKNTPQRLLISGDASNSSYIVNNSYNESGLALTVNHSSPGGYLINYENSTNSTGGLFFDTCDVSGNSTDTKMSLLTDGKLGLGTTDPQNTLDVAGNMVIGSGYAGTYDASTNGLLVEGAVCINKSDPFPDCMLSVVGNVRIQGDLSLNGVINIIDTSHNTTEMISITNDGTGPALFVKQTGVQPVAVFYDDDMPALYIQGKSDASGNIGFNTTNPRTMLHFVRSITASKRDRFLFTFENPSPSGYDWQMGPYINSSSGNRFILFGGDTSYNNYTSTTNPYISVDTNGNVGIGKMDPGYTLDVSGVINCETLQVQGAAPTFSQWTTDGSNIYYVNNGGYVGIGTTSPQQLLHVDGQVQATSFNATSDFRLKNDIKPLELCLDKVCNLQGVEFVRKGDEDKKQIGFIAQEIEKIVPEVVTTANDENGYKSVAYGNITALLVEAVKELRQEVKDLRAELQSYK